MSDITAERVNEIKGKLSQEQFAKSINSSQSVISKILKGETASITVLTDISKQYHVSVDWLLGLSTHKYLEGFSRYNSDNPITYADIIALVIRLIQSKSVSFLTQNSANEDIYNYPDYKAKNVSQLKINDCFLCDLISSANTILDTCPESIDSWEKKILEDYHIDVIEWDSIKESIYLSNRPTRTSFEILKDIVQPDNEQ